MKMPKVQVFRSLVKQRLAAAAEEIFGLFERTIAEYEEQLGRSQAENRRQRQLLDAVFEPQLRLRRTGSFIFWTSAPCLTRFHLLVLSQVDAP